jgi:hypothetical protein
MNPPDRRLLRRSALRPEESLPSFLIRLAALNHYDSPAIVYRLCLMASSAYEQADCPMSVDIFEVTAKLTGLEAHALYAATAHRFATVFTRPEDPLESWALPDGEQVPRLASGNVSRQLRSIFEAQFCPKCLQREPYHRLTWLSTAQAACLEHHCVLVDRCPACQAFISIRAIVQARCVRCQADLTRARCISTVRDPVGMLAQRMLHAWLMAEPFAVDDTWAMLADQPSAQLYQFVTDLRWWSVQAGMGWQHLHHIPGYPKHLAPPSLATHPSLSSDQQYRLTATAFKALLNWPQEFHAFLEAYGRDDRLPGKSAPPLDQRALYAQWCSKHWKHPAYQFIRQAFEEYLIQRYPETAFSGSAHQHHNRPIRAEQFAWIAVAEAAQLLQVPPEWIARLVILGYLMPLRPTGYGRAPCEFVRRAEVLTLSREWHEPLILNEAARWLGLPSEVVQALVASQRLKAAEAPAAVKPANWRISKQVVVDFWSALMNKAEFLLDATAELIDFWWLIFGWGDIHLGALPVLDRVWSGELRVYQPQSASDGLGELRFAKQDLRDMTWVEL